ncbi:DUF418 domain-containing protein [Allohahella marinimesophila]|uniref:DUF418 domain-containing protein n=1 Tax=Allohahella marinimesophila TaxID=1054972 RepID=A0ABP7NVP8_9GAMM
MSLVTEPASPSRIASLDVLRGLALLGLPTMNIIVFAMPSAAYVNPQAWGDGNALNDILFGFFYLFADQKFMGLFTLLFGASMLLLAEQSEVSGRNAASVHYRRTFWLLVIGLMHAWYLWEGDVLQIYAMIALLLYPFRYLNPLTLLVIAACALNVTLYLSHFPDISEATIGADGRYDLKAYFQPDIAQVEEQRAMYLGSHEDTVAAVRGTLATEFTDSEHSADLILAKGGLAMLVKVFGMMCLGMALYKLGVLQGWRTSREYRRLAGICLGIGLPLTGFGLWWNYAQQWNMDAWYAFGMIPQHLGAVFMTVAYAALVLLALRTVLPKSMATALAAVGRMALTNYLMQSLICALLFYGYGLGLYGSLSRLELLPIIVGIWCGQILLSLIWLRYFLQGPVEWLWRTLTYFNLQPMLRRRVG